MHTAVRIILWILAITLVIAMGLFAYLRNADLSVYEEPIEEALSDIVGHEVRIDGLFQLQFGTLTTLTAEQVLISNPDWADDPVLLRVGHFSTTVNTWSLLKGPVVVPMLQLRDIDIRIHKDEESNLNWDSGRPVEADTAEGSFDSNRIAVELLQVDAFRLSLTDPSRRRPLNLRIDQLAVAPDQDRMLELDLSGAVNEFGLEANGHLGPWENLLTGEDLAADMSLTLGQVVLMIDGYIANLRELEGADLTLNLAGPSIDRVADVLGWPPFATGEFDIDGRILKVDAVNELRLEGHLGDIEVFLAGETDRLRDSSNAAIEFRVAGPDTQYVAELLGVKGARPAPFRVAGDLQRTGTRLRLSDTLATLGENRLEIDGWFDFEMKLPDMDVSVRASGPDLSHLGPLARVENLPAETFEVDGEIQKIGDLWNFDDFQASLGENRFSVNGRLSGEDDAGSAISVRAVGPDISFLQPFTGLRGLPARPYDVNAHISPDPSGIRLTEAGGVFGENRISVDGVIGTEQGLTGTRVSVKAAGPDLTNIALLTDLPFLPRGPFDAQGLLSLDRGRLNIESAAVTVGEISASASGSVGLAANAGEFDLDVSAQGPDLAELLRFDWLQRAAGQPFTIAGQVSERRDRYEFADVDVSIGTLRLGAEGRVADNADTFDVTFAGTSPDSHVLGEILRIEKLPGGDFSTAGRVERSDRNIKVSDLDVRIGEFSVMADGTLSGSPMSNDSDFNFSLTGPDLRQFGMPFGIATLPAKTFGISGVVSGVPRGFTIEDFVAKIGDNDISAGFMADLRAKPTISGKISATYLDLKSALATPEEPDQEEEDAPRELLFSDESVDLAWLDSVNLDVNTEIGTLMLRTADMYDFRMGLNLQDGALSVEPFAFRGTGGALQGRLQLAPVNSAYRLDAELNVENARIGLLAGEEQERSSLPPISGSIALAGTGSSIHEILAAADGRISLRQGAGQIRDIASSQLVGDVVLEVFRTFNPMHQKEAFTTLNCAFYDIDIENGIAAIDNVAIQTDKLNILTFGSTNLADETLNLTLRATPREGIGISIAGVANSFLKLGGTFLEPRLEIDTKSSVTTGGVAVATGGISLLARGLWDRMSAENDICAGPAPGPDNR